jgi:hypothetical protein
LDGVVNLPELLGGGRGPFQKGSVAAELDIPPGQQLASDGVPAALGKLLTKPARAGTHWKREGRFTLAFDKALLLHLLPAWLVVIFAWAMQRFPDTSALACVPNWLDRALLILNADPVGDDDQDNGNPAHIDFTDSVNISAAVETPGQPQFTTKPPGGEPVAIWVHVSPPYIAPFLVWLKEMATEKGMEEEFISYIPTQEQFRRLQRDQPLGVGASFYDVRMEEQAVGDAVHVRAGFLHIVRNLKACVKVAFDVHVPANSRRYSEALLFSRRHLGLIKMAPNDPIHSVKVARDSVLSMLAALDGGAASKKAKP